MGFEYATDIYFISVIPPDPSSANRTKWSNTLNSSATADKLIMFDYFVGLVIKTLTKKIAMRGENPCKIVLMGKF